MIKPVKYKDRVAINSLTGIKSSLAHIRSVISLTYLLYLANNRRSSIVYSRSDEAQSISLRPEYTAFIKEYLGDTNIDSDIVSNPLLTSQIESLYVGITLMFGLGRISFENSSLGMTKERTGGTRYPKKIDFASNIVLLDTILQSADNAERQEFLKSWLKDRNIDSELELRIATFLNICIENNLFKLRDGDNDIFFQTEGIYLALQREEEVSLESDEKVGPARILNSMLREDLIPWLTVKNSTVKINNNCNFDVASYTDILSTSLDIRDIKVDAVEEIEQEDETTTHSSLSLQQIFYGAPGTGKSHKIKDDADVKAADEKNLVFRTTFHPDSDYSTFVGCYKPTKAISKRLQRMNLSLEDLAKELGSYYTDEEFGKIGGIQKFCFEYYPYIDGEYMSVNVTKLLELAGVPKDYNVEINKYIKFCHLLPKQETDKITYTFVPQAFTNAYVEAWNTDENVYLIIEEINRGNCAQIFGDLFQLLDRKNGVSEYPIEADTDLQNYICKALVDTKRTDIPEEVKSGKKLMLPSNLYIWATMNTSDQSLFPIDSAFKRRWDWKYIKIKEGKDENGNKLDWKVDVKMDESGTLITWWDFIKKINEIIASMTSSADKQLGYFFCCAKDGVIDEETFVSKVIFYLWNDVFKDYGFEDASLFRYTSKDEDGRDTEKDLSFPDFYDEEGEKVNTERLTDFVKKVMSWKKTNAEQD